MFFSVAASLPFFIISVEKSKNTPSLVSLFSIPKPASHLSLAALEATSLGTKLPNAGYLLSK